MTYRPQISIVGSRSLGDDALALIRKLSTRLVDEGYRIVTGGLGTLPNAVHLGATSSSSYTSGDTIALLPGFDPKPAMGHADIIIPTGLDVARNILVANGDAVIAIGGGRRYTLRNCICMADESTNYFRWLRWLGREINWRNNRSSVPPKHNNLL